MILNCPVTCAFVLYCVSGLLIISAGLSRPPVNVQSVRMTSSNDTLRPGIHQRFAYVPHQEPIKCLAHCSQKRFLSVDDNSNVALWVSSMNQQAIMILLADR